MTTRRATRALLWLATLLLLAIGVALAGPAARAQAPEPFGEGDVARDAGLQWGLDRIRAPEAWETARGAGIVIAVIDSGVALDHEDLRHRLVPGVACQNTGGNPDACRGSPQDDDGHGTHVAGVAAAHTGNGIGVAGVAPEARIQPIKVLFRSCPSCPSTGEAADVSAAIRWAADHGADVINLSLGSNASSLFGPGFADAVDHAWQRGAIPVVAAGNEYVLTADLGSSPAVVVSATTREDTAPSFTNGTGQGAWAVSAPGGSGDDTPDSCASQGRPEGILSTYWAPDDPVRAYACLSGTSMAAPHVSGALAILRSAGADHEEAVAALVSTAVDLGPPGPDDVFGAGRVDVAAALDAIGAPLDDVPVVVANQRTPPAITPSPRVTEPVRFGEESSRAVPTWLAIVAAIGVAGSGAATLRRLRHLL